MRLKLIVLLLIPVLSFGMDRPGASQESVLSQQEEIKQAYCLLAARIGFEVNDHHFTNGFLAAEELEKKYAEKLSPTFYNILYRNEIIYLLGAAQAHLAMVDQVVSSQIDAKLKKIQSDKQLGTDGMQALFQNLSVERFALGQARSNLISIQQLSKRIRKKAGL